MYPFHVNVFSTSILTDTHKYTQKKTKNYKRTIKRLYSVSFRFLSFQDLHWLYSFRSLCAFLASPGCRYLLICGQQWTTVGDLWGPMGTSPPWGSPSTYHSWKDVWGDYLIICDYQVSRCFTMCHASCVIPDKSGESSEYVRICQLVSLVFHSTSSCCLDHLLEQWGTKPDVHML